MIECQIGYLKKKIWNYSVGGSSSGHEFRSWNGNASQRPWLNKWYESHFYFYWSDVFCMWIVCVYIITSHVALNHLALFRWCVASFEFFVVSSSYIVMKLLNYFIYLRSEVKENEVFFKKSVGKK